MDSNPIKMSMTSWEHIMPDLDIQVPAECGLSATALQGGPDREPSQGQVWEETVSE